MWGPSGGVPTIMMTGGHGTITMEKHGIIGTKAGRSWVCACTSHVLFFGAKHISANIGLGWGLGIRLYIFKRISL